jgi:hypothetical protein
MAWGGVLEMVSELKEDADGTRWWYFGSDGDDGGDDDSVCVPRNVPAAPSIIQIKNSSMILKNKKIVAYPKQTHTHL